MVCEKNVCGNYRYGKITYRCSGSRNTGIPARKIPVSHTKCTNLPAEFCGATFVAKWAVLFRPGLEKASVPPRPVKYPSHADVRAFFASSLLDWALYKG